MSLAIVFPGQGSQSLGMLAELAAAYPVVSETFSQASQVLGYDLWMRVQQGPEVELNKTSITQPAMLAAGVATWRVWVEQGGPKPVVMAGHSLGEYTALVCAGSLEFADAVALVAERGRYMQEAVPQGTGAMAAIIGLEDDAVIQLCAEAAQGQIVSAVNFNTPGQVVIAGHAEAVQRGIDLAKQRGAKRVMLLPVSVPSHCLLMKPAAERLAERLSVLTFRPPEISVLHNVDVVLHHHPDSLRDALRRQLYNPVRWGETIRKMAQQGVKQLIECGPGKVLATMNKRIDKAIQAQAIYDPASLQQALTMAKENG